MATIGVVLCMTFGREMVHVAGVMNMKKWL